ncbi:MAG: hypothetical protein ABI361_14075 [Nitrososphaera sp.]|jgi:hypothetical protein
MNQSALKFNNLLFPDVPFGRMQWQCGTCGRAFESKREVKLHKLEMHSY